MKLSRAPPACGSTRATSSRAFHRDASVRALHLNRRDVLEAGAAGLILAGERQNFLLLLLLLDCCSILCQF